MVGEGELADIAMLVAGKNRFELSVVSQNANFFEFDALLVTDIVSPQATYDAVRTKVHEKKIMTLDLLHIMRVKQD